MSDGFEAGLNPEQIEAVRHVSGPLLILAGAGSGKTRVLTHRAAYLVAHGHARPERILMVTFTNKATDEMAQRIAALLGPAGDAVWVRTFHSFGLKLIRSGLLGATVDPKVTVLDEGDQKQALRGVLEALKMDPERHNLGAIARRIEDWKNRALTPSDVGLMPDEGGGLPLGEVYRRYQDELRRLRAADFGDLLLWPVVAMKQNREVRDQVRNQFDFVMVDEFQDTNAIQYELLRLIAGGHGNLAVVGDDDQAIYGWRGANLGNILGFENDFSGTRVVKLEQNYRSTKVILDAAWEVVRRNKRRRPKRLWTNRSGGEPIVVAALADEQAEADWVGEIAARQIAAGTSPNEIAVFYRTNAQSRLFEAAMRQRNIRYRVVGNTAFYERKEVKDLLAYMRLVVNPHDWVSLARIVNVPRRGIGKATMDRLVELGRERRLNVFDALGEAAADGSIGTRAARLLGDFRNLLQGVRARADQGAVADTAEALVTVLDFQAWLQLDDRESAADRWDNVQELLASMRQYEDAAEEPTLAGYLDEVSLVTDLAHDPKEAAQPAVHLMTLHNAKGLEFDCVFVCGLEEGLLPHSRSLDDEGIEEERRLVYVGMTRARKLLYLARARTRRTYGARTSQVVSRFLAEIPPEYIEDRSPRSTALSPAFLHRSPLRTGTPGSSGKVQSAARDRTAPLPDVPVEFQPGRKLRHPTFGIGTVREVDFGSQGIRLKMQFADGVRTILPAFVELRPA